MQTHVGDEISSATGRDEWRVGWKEGAGRWQRGREDSSLGAPLACRKQEESWFWRR